MLPPVGEAEGEFVSGVPDSRYADLDPRLRAGRVPLPGALRGAVVCDHLGAVHERIEVVDGPGERLQSDLDFHGSGPSERVAAKISSRRPAARAVLRHWGV